jgi:processive 1,2-diacylglycerol beta-glucosyltransferase
MNSKRILIITASVGSGHDQAAATVARSIASRDNSADVEVIDFMNILHPTISQFIVNTYLKMIDLFPTGYHFIYHITKKFSTHNKVSDLISYRYQKKIKKLIIAKNPDMIVFTNPFPSVLISSLKKKGSINIPTATIITDYTAHPVWLDDTIDLYFVGSYELKECLVEKGIKRDRIYVSGIPIHEKFDLKLDKEKIEIKEGINPDLPTILVMGGGLGLGPIKEILDAADEIRKPLQLLVVAGKNQQLRTELESRSSQTAHSVKIYGFCDNIHELMEVSDLLISKSGGLTMTEALNKQLPTIIVDPIPGQEVVNAKYLSRIGAARLLDDLKDLKKNIDELLFEAPESRREMERKALKAAKPRASLNIAKVLLKNINTHKDKKPRASILK